MTGARGWRIGVGLIWLAAAIILSWLFRARILAGTPADGDDYLRLLEVRDWLAGQSWFDVTQYRMNPPTGGAMHWSRLVDLPIAGGLALLVPIVGARAAEAVTVTLVPLALLAGVMAAAAATTFRLLGSAKAAVGAAALLLMTPFVMAQLFPTRIDHHGWQLLMAAITTAMLVGERSVRAGLIAGVALGFWLAVSIEGLPFAVAAAGATVLRWLVDPVERARLTGLMLGLAGSALLFFAATQPLAAWSGSACDALSPAHLAALATAALGTVAVVRLGEGWPLPIRVAAIGGVAVCAALLFLARAPACAADPFGGLDPLVHRVWYLHVSEGLPIWRQPAGDMVGIIAFPLIGLAGALRSWRGTQAGSLPGGNWATLILLLLASLAIALLVKRASGVAHLIAIPGAIALIAALAGRSLASPLLPIRLFGTTLACIALTPVASAWLGTAMFANAAAPARKIAGACDERAALSPLGHLPPSNLLAPLDAGPPLLAFTPHRIVAAGYHRNDAAMAEVIRAFTGDPHLARQIVARRGISYVVVEPGSNEARLYAEMNPAGLMARLRAGRPPAWLEGMPLGCSNFSIWRVRG
jgi:hypothetical protein